MKNLKERIEDVLPTILPKTFSDAITGADLAKLVIGKLPNEKESSVRQTFSSLHQDQNSCLAKIPNKQGFYLRAFVESGVAAESLPKKGKLGADSGQDEAGKRAWQREEKFRSVFMRYSEFNGLFPMNIEHTKGKKEEKGLNRWKYPDVVLVDWEVGETINDEYTLNTMLLEIRKGLGEQPFQLTSAELKTELSFSNYRECFFQCVSNSKWAHNATLSVACDIQDSKLQTELARLGKSYGVTIETYGLSNNKIDEFPNAEEILNMADSKFENLAKDIEITTISASQGKDSLDWDQLNDLRSQNSDFDLLLFWIAKCLREGKAYSYQHYKKLAEIEAQYVKA